MTLGEKICQARQEAGLSQRQLSEPQITRNMLSRIEHGTVQPSMTTLKYLAQRLGKPVSWFFGEQGTVENGGFLEKARSLYRAGEYAAVVSQLSRDTPDWEQQLLLCLSDLELARQALEQGQQSHARTLLRRSAQAAEATPYGAFLSRELILLRYQAGEDPVRLAQQLPEDDRELLLRADAAGKAGDTARAAALLTAAGQQDSPLWNLMQGQTLFDAKAYAEAAACFRKAEQAYPRETIPRLETCYRELEDYKQAYFYACKQRP